MADHLYIRYVYMSDSSALLRSRAETMWIEWKRVRPRGNFNGATKAQQHQKTWHQQERARGALTLIAGEDFPATIEGFISWYETSGLQRRTVALRTA